MSRSKKEAWSLAQRFAMSGTEQKKPMGEAVGFTLIEVLVVVAIIGLLVAILFPSLRQARIQARRTVCLNNLHQLGIALYAYQAVHKGQPPHWKFTGGEVPTDEMALWVSGSHATRLGMLYPHYVGGNENVFYCPDAATNQLLNKGSDGSGIVATYPWRNYGTGRGWAYGSYSYRPRYYVPEGGAALWVGLNYDKLARRLSIAADAFSGMIDSWGPFPAHTPIQQAPKTLYYNIAYTDGSAQPVRDHVYASNVAPFGFEFRTRAASPAQQRPYYVNNPQPGGVAQSYAPEYTPAMPINNEPLPPYNGTEEDRRRRETILRTSNNAERGWSFFDRR